MVHLDKISNAPFTLNYMSSNKIHSFNLDYIPLLNSIEKLLNIKIISLHIYIYSH